MSEFYSFDSKGRLIRNFKGKSFIDFPDTYVVIDLETTGFDSNYDEIIEASALKIINNKIEDSFETLIKPNDLYFSLDPFITELTGITDDDLKNAPLMKEVINTYLDFIGDNIIVGHNVNFDINFLYKACTENLNQPFNNNFIDTLRLSRKLNKNIDSHRLDYLIEFYNIGERTSHRALNDCILTAKLFENLKKTTLNKFASLDEFITTSKCSSTSYKINDGIIILDTQISSIYKRDESNLLFNKTCVFTGKLDKMLRQDAMAIVNSIGGFVSDRITDTTNYLILGDYDYCQSVKEGKSNKHKKAEELIRKGYDITIISENVFYELINEVIND